MKEQNYLHKTSSIINEFTVYYLRVNETFTSKERKRIKELVEEYGHLSEELQVASKTSENRAAINRYRKLQESPIARVVTALKNLE